MHWRMVHWLDTCTHPTRVLLVFRGAAKSTLYAVYKAYRLWKDNDHRSLVWAADDKLATKLTRDTLAVLRRHPWCKGMLPTKPGAQSFWVTNASDARNPSMDAVGINTNATGSRADATDFDDVEVPKNIRSAEGRENLRARMDESTHILVPKGQKTWIGTPHTSDSIYTEQIDGGAAVLKIPLFRHHTRHEDSGDSKRLAFNFSPESDGLYVFVGIGRHANLLIAGRDYTIDGRHVVLTKAARSVVDIYSGCAWPARFTRAEIRIRRRGTKTLNAWDSQYQLHAKPLNEIRLDPEKLVLYDVEPEIRQANGVAVMWLGGTQIVSATCRIDPASGKLHSDVSSLSLTLQDAKGRIYWHRAIDLRGEIAEYSADGRELIGGQVLQVCAIVEQFNLGRVDVETIGLGVTWPTILRSAFKQRGLNQTGIRAIPTVANKNARILDAIEPLLRSGHLWAHTSVYEVVEPMMRDWNPGVRDQPDDHLDSGAGAIEAEPARIGSAVIIKKSESAEPYSWQPSGGVHEFVLDMSQSIL
jgi:hypothetical protein